MIRKPPRLRAGDLVAVVAPSGCPPYEDQIRKGVQFLEGFGLRVRIGRSVTEGRGYMNRDRKLRAGDLNAQFADRRVRGIFCLVGGFSAFELLDLLDYPRIARNPKVFMGFSDNTSLLNAVRRKTGLVTFMGENVLWGLSEGRAETREWFARTLLEARPPGALPGAVESWRDARPATGRVVAGNLWSLSWVAGTEYEPDWRGGVVFWEDVGENVDDVNSAVWRLRAAGAFPRIRGMVVGHLEGIEEEKFGVTVRESVLRASGQRWPIVKADCFGHHVPCFLLPIGARCRVGGGAVSIEEAGVEG
jgi:muramoyltetrapeptide carboxypeptidase